MIDGRPAMASTTLALAAVGKKIMTIESLGGENPDAVPLAFVKHDAQQCGFCTPGMILKAYSFLAENPQPTQGEIITAMDDNLCRCGSHVRIVQAIQTAAKLMKEGKQG